VDAVTRFVRHRVDTDVASESYLKVHAQVEEKSGALWYSMYDCPVGQVETVVSWPADTRIADFVRDVLRRGVLA